MDIRVNAVNPVAAAEAAKTREVERNEEFMFTLNRLGEEGLAERLKGLIDDITSLGSRLTEHMDIADLRQYKSKIGEFINEVVTNSHQFSRENFLDRRGRHRVLSIVRVVNQDLDDLAQELLKKEKDHIKILETTEEIQGLLLDLLI